MMAKSMVLCRALLRLYREDRIPIVILASKYGIDSRTVKRCLRRAIEEKEREHEIPRR